MKRQVNGAIHISQYVLLISLIGSGLAQLNSQDEKSAVLEESALAQLASENTLVSDNIRCVSTSADYVWVATDRGVSIYHKADSRWTKLDWEDGLVSDDVTALSADREFLWVGTTLGISLYNIENGSLTKFQRRDGLASNKVTAIAVDGNYTWVGTESGISRYDKTTGTWALQREKDKDRFNSITAIAVESEYVWFGTENGLRRYDKLKDAWNAYTKEDGLVENHVRCIALSPDSVWVGTEKSGVSKYSVANQSFTESYTRTDLLESDFIRAIAVDGDNVWFGSADRGIRRFISTVNTWFKYTTGKGLVSDHISWLHVDGGHIWIGTYEFGLGQFDKTNDGWTWYSKRDSLVSNQIKSVVSTEKALWIGTNKGLSRYAPQKKSWKTFTKADGLVTNYITHLTKGVDNSTIWVGTPLGLGALVGKQWRFYTERHGLANDYVTGISAVPGKIWVATKGGVSSFSVTANRETGIEQTSASTIGQDSPHVSSGVTLYDSQTYLTSKWVTAVLVIGQNVWAGTTDGLYRINDETGEFEPVLEVRNYVNALSSSVDRQLLVGTRNGLWIIGGEKSSHITEGLPNLNVRSVAEDNGTIWVGTPGGVARLNDGNVNQVITMQAAGLLHDNVRSIVVSDQQVFFGTAAGLAIYNVEKNQWEQYKPYYDTEILKEEQIRWIELDEHNLWALNWSSSPNGAILKFDRRTETWIEYTKYALPLSSNVPFITEIHRLAVGEEDVWFAAGDGGVLRYNKASDTWTHITMPTGIPGHQAMLIELDGPNGVWVSFQGGIAGKYDTRTQQWETVKVTDSGAGTRIEDIACTNDYVWFATNSAGVRRYEQATQTWKSYTEAQGMASRFTPWIDADGEGVWTSGGTSWSWVSDRGVQGVSFYRPKENSWTFFDRRNGLRAEATGYGQVGKDYVWCFGGEGINRYHKTRKSWTSFNSSDGLIVHNVRAVARDSDGFWVGSDESGIWKYAQASGAWTVFTVEDGLIDGSVQPYALKVGPEHVWVGTSQGLSRYDKRRRTWISLMKPATLADRRAVSVAADSQFVWVGTHRGLSRYDKRYDRWRHFRTEEQENEDNGDDEDDKTKQEKRNQLVDNSVVDLSVGVRYVWIATEGGVGRYDKIANRFESYTHENQLPSVDIRAVAENESDVWIGTKNGIGKHSILSEDRNAWETFNTAIEILPTVKGKYAKSLENDDVRCLAVDDFRVWVGTKTGVSLYEIEKGTWSTFTQKDGLASDEVSCITFDGGRVWFGSGRGVTVYDTENDTWKVLTEADGLGSNLITSIANHRSQIWFGTFDSGATVYDKITGKFTTFTKADGLPHNGILSITADGNCLWFGTHGGLTRYDSLAGTWTVYTERFDYDGL